MRIEFYRPIRLKVELKTCLSVHVHGFFSSVRLKYSGLRTSSNTPFIVSQTILLISGVSGPKVSLKPVFQLVTDRPIRVVNCE